MSNSRSLLKSGIQSLNVGKLAHISKKIKFEPPQNEGPEIEAPQIEGAQTEVPQNEVAQNERPQIDRGVLTNFFPLSFDFFSHPMVKELSGDGFRVFLWLNAHAWQFPNSKGHFQASVGRVSRATGVSEANASRILAILQKSGLIRHFKSDAKYGNVWEVEDLAKARSKLIRQHPQNERAALSN